MKETTLQTLVKAYTNPNYVYSLGKDISVTYTDFYKKFIVHHMVDKNKAKSIDVSLDDMLEQYVSKIDDIVETLAV